MERLRAEFQFQPGIYYARHDHRKSSHMYKPKNTTPQNSNRLRLDIEQKMPTIFAIEQQLMEAKSRRGCLIELPWVTGKANQLFILGVQWDANQDLPIWTLYEQNNLESKMHWSEQYPPGDLQIMYDVVAMSVTGDEQTKIPDNLKPGKTDGAHGGAPGPVALPPGGGPGMPFPPGAGPGMPFPPGGFGPMPGQAGYGMPGGYAPPGQPPFGPMPGQPYPMDPNAMPPGYPYPPYYGVPGAPGYPGAPPVPPPGWPYAPPGAPPTGAAPTGAPPPTPAAAGPIPAVSPLSPSAPAERTEPTAKPAVDYTLMAKRSKLQLGKLLVDAKIISQSTLDAALKMQELVEDEQVMPENAPTALGKYHTKGSAIGEYVNLPDNFTEESEKVRTKIGEVPEVSKLPITPPKSSTEAKAAFELLKKAGILSEEDMRAASEVRRKHGGDIIQILQSAGKIDKYTFEATLVCLPLTELGLMKLEQVVIALQYCNRMRVDFDAALEELGWQNPRKMRKDLQL